MSTIGIVAVGRPTFDLELAAHHVDAAVGLLQRRHAVVGDPSIRTEPGTWTIPPCDVLVILQATFADSRLAQAAAAACPDRPIVLWAFPEARTGSRLRLNSLCGLNLAAASLSGRDLRYVYQDAGTPAAGEAVEHALGAPLRAARRAPLPASPADAAVSDRIARRLGTARIGRVGMHPAGFGPCDFDGDDLAALGGAKVDFVPLETLFAAVRSVEPTDPTGVSRGVGAEALDPRGVETTLRIHAALGDLASERHWLGVATRCWPECFDDLGGAACAALGHLGDQGVPGTCESDVMGVFTSIALTMASGHATMVADLVDAEADGTLAFWHCGVAPPSMAHPAEPIEAVEHPNRHVPLLSQFRLRPGRVTIARLNHSGDHLRMIVGGGEILDRPRPYAGTCGVVRPDTPARDLLDTVIAEGLDHHYGLTHGDVGGAMTALAGRLGLEVVAL